MENLSKDENKVELLRFLADVLSNEYNFIWDMSENCDNENVYFTRAYYKGYIEALHNIGKQNGLKPKCHNGTWYFSNMG